MHQPLLVPAIKFVKVLEGNVQIKNSRKCLPFIMGNTNIDLMVVVAKRY